VGFETDSQMAVCLVRRWVEAWDAWGLLPRC